MERYSIKQGELFKSGDTFDLERLLKQEATNRIQKLEDDYVLNVSEMDYINYLSEELRIDCPEVLFDDCSLVTRKVLVPNEYLPEHIGYFYQGELERTMYRLCIPFNGDKDVLRFCPSQYTLGGSGRFCFDYNEIYVDILDSNGNGENVAREIKTI